MALINMSFRLAWNRAFDEVSEGQSGTPCFPYFEKQQRRRPQSFPSSLAADDNIVVSPRRKENKTTTNDKTEQVPEQHDQSSPSVTKKSLIVKLKTPAYLVASMGTYEL